MTVTLESAAQFVGISPDEPVLPALLAAAEAAVKDYLRPSGERRITNALRDLAVLTATTELWRRRNAPGGVASWSPDGVTPVRLSADFMKPVKPLLDPYRGVGGVG